MKKYAQAVYGMSQIIEVNPVLWSLNPKLYSNTNAIELVLGHAFVRKELLCEALTHRSALVGVKGLMKSDLDLRPWNERLEFLGDSVLSLVVSELLMSSREGLSEGDMSRIRASMVCEANLAKVAKYKLNLSQFLVVGGSELGSAGLEKSSLLADALEAIIGAVFVDAGWEVAKRVTRELFQEEFSRDFQSLLTFDAKTQLQELMQAKFKLTPIYDVIAESGPAHQKNFTVSVKMGEQYLAEGAGVSKKEAAQEAARNALKYIAEVSL